MYFLSVLLLTLIFPAGSVWADHAYFHDPLPLMMLAAKWFVFWAVGVRLSVAGIRQQIQPRFTSETIFGIGGDAPLPFVRELGVANLAAGTVGLLSLLRPDFVLPAAVAATVFYGLAGIRHFFQPHRNFNENVALVSDLALGLFFAAWIGLTIAANAGR